MKSRLIVGLLAGLQLIAAGPGYSQSDRPGGGTILGGILRGLADAISQKHGGRVPPPGSGHGHRHDAPRVFNVVDPRTGDDGRVVQGQVFQIVGDSFGKREGQVALLPEGATEWYIVRDRGIQEWRDDTVTVVISESPFPGRQTRIAVGIITADGHSDAIRDITFYSSSSGHGHGPGGLPPIIPNRPGGHDWHDIPATVPWAVHSSAGNPDESPSSPLAMRTLASMGPAPIPGPSGANTRHWTGGTVGLFTLGAPSSPPWFHFVIGLASGTPNAARLAKSAAEAGAKGERVRPGAGLTPHGGFPALVISSEKLSRDQQVMHTLPDRTEDEMDARLLREALRMSVPTSVGRLRLSSVDEIGRQDWGRGAKSVVKCLSGEGRNMNVVAFLVNSHERTREGWRTVRSLRVAIIANGTHSADSCHRLLGGR